MRLGARSLRGAGIAALAVGVFMAAAMAAERWRVQVDLTADRTLTLSRETREVVAGVDSPVRVSAVIARGQAGRAEAASLLDRYRRVNRRITYRLVDPEQSPGEVRRLGVDPALGGLAVTMGDRIERAPTVSEQDVTAALARLLRPVALGVCFASGHGENDVASTTGPGLAAAAGSLVANGYRIRVLDLLLTPDVPRDCDALVLASPQAPLGEAEVAVARYLRGGGRALVLAEPGSIADLRPLLRPYGLGYERGLLLEGDPGARLGDDPVTPVVRSYPSANPTVRRLPPTLFPGAQAVTVTPREGVGLSVTALASTTPVAYLERTPSRPRFDPGEDLPGPHAIAAAADRSRVEEGVVTRTRVVVVGDVDFATNGFLGEGGNSRFFVQAVDWLTLDEDLVSVSTHLPAYRPLALTSARLAYARFLGSAVVPGLFLLAGALLWAVRRPR